MPNNFSPAQVAFYVEAIIEEDRISGDGRDRIQLDYERLARRVERQAQLYLFGLAFARSLADAFRQYAHRDALERATAFIEARLDGQA